MGSQSPRSNVPSKLFSCTGTCHIWLLPVQMYVDPKDKDHGIASPSWICFSSYPCTSPLDSTYICTGGGQPAICVGSPYRYLAPGEEDHQCCPWLLLLLGSLDVRGSRVRGGGPSPVQATCEPCLYHALVTTEAQRYAGVRHQTTTRILTLKCVTVVSRREGRLR